MLQKTLPGIFSGTGRGLHDHWRIELGGCGHDRLHLFKIVDVERWNAVIVFGSVIQQLSHGHQGHGPLLVYEVSDEDRDSDSTWPWSHCAGQR